MRYYLAAALPAMVAATACSAQPVPLLGPGGTWRVAYTGYGHVAASTHLGAPRLILTPARPASPAETHAALVLSRQSWQDLTIVIRIRTNSQLRRPRPRPWEVGWLLWHYGSDQRFYYLALKPNGWELGKETPAYPGNQHFLATGAHPAFPPGRWFTVRIQQRGDTITVDADGHRLVRYTDTNNPYRSGRVGLYTEDASATFQPITIEGIR